MDSGSVENRLMELAQLNEVIQGRIDANVAVKSWFDKATVLITEAFSRIEYLSDLIEEGGENESGKTAAADKVG